MTSADADLSHDSVPVEIKTTQIHRHVLAKGAQEFKGGIPIKELKINPIPANLFVLQAKPSTTPPYQSKTDLQQIISDKLFCHYLASRRALSMDVEPFPTLHETG